MSYFRIGCCLPGGSFMKEGVSVDNTAYDMLKTGYNGIIDAGFDYAEATVGLIMKLTDDEFNQAVADGYKFPVYNSFIPPALAIATTPLSELESYVDKAMYRMSSFGGEGVIFGSGAARRDAGEKELYDFIYMCDKLAGKYGMYVALEPLNQKETNWLYTVKEGYDICRKLKLPNLKVLADAYHMALENESAAVLSEVSSYLTHVHVSDADRKYPGRDGGAYLKNFAAELKKSGYTGRVSAECGFDDFTKESKLSCEFMKEVF